jgi:F-type H+-transporting ATPase subunit delta
LADWGFVVGNSVTNRYVKSLYNIAAKSGLERDIAKELYSIKSYILSIKNYEKFLKRISLLSEDGIKFVESVKMKLKLSKYMSNFMDLLLHNKRLDVILDICAAYEAFLNQIDNKKFFYLTFAKEISDSLVKQFTEYLEKSFGGKVECIVKHDSSLIDGVKVQYRSRILDYSLKSRLKRLHCVIRSGSYEN